MIQGYRTLNIREATNANGTKVQSSVTTVNELLKKAVGPLPRHP
jgi:hypothetical protein